MNPYGPVASYLCVALAAALLFTVLPGLLGRRKPNAEKAEAYECGVEPTSAVAGRFPVRFYLVAMLFVIFDVEAASFYPWAVQMHALRVFGLSEMIIFVIVLAIGYAYVWKKAPPRAAARAPTSSARRMRARCVRGRGLGRGACGGCGRGRVGQSPGRLKW
jgi:NADH:ubiquinone oxidoreductase subunit 3 (subunit A)